MLYPVFLLHYYLNIFNICKYLSWFNKILLVTVKYIILEWTYFFLLLQDLCVLNDVLGRRQFVCGARVSVADRHVYTSLVDRLPSSPVNVTRWAQHMAAITSTQLLSLPHINNVPSSGDTQVIITFRLNPLYSPHYILSLVRITSSTIEWN